MNLTAELVELRRRRSERPLPEVDVDRGPSVPGWVFRVLAPLTVGVLVVLAGLRAGLMTELVLVVGAAFAGWVVFRPSPAPSHLAVLVASLVSFGASGGPFDVVVLGLVPIALVAVRLTWWAEHVGRRSHVEAAALRRTGLRDLTVLAVTAMIGGVAWIATGFAIGGFVVVGAGALIALVISLLGGYRR